MSDKYSIKSTAQEFLDIHDITNNTIILKNGTCSIILTVNAMNFDLLAEQEQDAVIYTYAALLNSLNYPIQINIQSKTKDITAYLKLLEDQQEKTADKRKKQLISQYRQFVGELITERNVLDKKFYVIIPTTALEMGLLTTQGLLPGSKAFDISTIEKTTILEKAASILEPRKDHLTSQFARIGLVAKQLNTQEIIQVFYNNYNPEAADGQQITNSNSYTTPLVRASMRGSMNDFSQGSLPPTPPAQPIQAEPVAPESTIPVVPEPVVTTQPVNPVPVEPQVSAVDMATAQAAIQESVAPLTTPDATMVSPEPAPQIPVVTPAPVITPASVTQNQNFQPVPGLEQVITSPVEEVKTEEQPISPPAQL